MSDGETELGEKRDHRPHQRASLPLVLDDVASHGTPERARGWIGTRPASPGHGKVKPWHYMTQRSQSPSETGLNTPEGRLLATMPLHAIAAVHGEDGLRGRLLIEAGRFLSAHRARIGTALALMSRLYERDRRQREPYANHYADLRVMPTWWRELLVAA